MTNSHQYQTQILQDRYGLKIAARLSAGAAELPHDISERLRVARVQALGKRKAHAPAQASLVVASGSTAVLGTPSTDLPRI